VSAFSMGAEKVQVEGRGHGGKVVLGGEVEQWMGPESTLGGWRLGRFVRVGGGKE